MLHLSLRAVLVALILPLGVATVTARAAQAETAAPANAVSAEELQRLSRTMRMEEVFAVMAEEGADYGDTIETQMFPDRGGGTWKARVGAIYDPAYLLPIFTEAFNAALVGDPDTVAAAMAFFDTPRGQEILKLEIEARRALLEPDIKEEAQVLADTLKAERDPKLRLIRRLIEGGDLIETNVAGAMSANLAFFEGMDAVGAPGVPMDRDTMMAEVWGQEGSIRTEVASWMIPYMALAYQPLSEADLKAYVDFSASPEGKLLNAAMVAGFDAVARKVSFALGQSAAKIMAGTDI